jgi:hypothetical protein
MPIGATLELEKGLMKRFRNEGTIATKRWRG